MRFTSRTNCTPHALLLWAVLLLFGQSAALAHQHDDHAPVSSCAVCTLANAETAACDSGSAAVPAGTGFAPVRAADVPHVRQQRSRHYQPRAPPRR